MATQPLVLKSNCFRYIDSWRTRAEGFLYCYPRTFDRPWNDVINFQRRIFDGVGRLCSTSNVRTHRIRFDASSSVESSVESSVKFTKRSKWFCFVNTSGPCYSCFWLSTNNKGKKQPIFNWFQKNIERVFSATLKNNEGRLCIKIETKMHTFNFSEIKYVH